MGLINELGNMLRKIKSNQKKFMHQVNLWFIKKIELIFSFLLLIFMPNEMFAESIERSGNISTFEEWSDTVHVVGDITILQNGKLVIYAGTYIEFQDQYKIEVKENGIIQANGNSIDSIKFVSCEPESGSL